MRVPYNNFDVEEMFTEEDKAFNRKMVEQAKSYDDGKSQKSIQKNYDFSSKILSDFSQKWGLK